MINWFRNKFKKKYIKITPQELRVLLDNDIELLLTDDIPGGFRNPFWDLYRSGRLSLQEIFDMLNHGLGSKMNDSLHKEIKRLYNIHFRQLRLLANLIKRERSR